jgi:endonuclease YncB( thermonuclease family)
MMMVQLMNGLLKLMTLFDKESFKKTVQIETEGTDRSEVNFVGTLSYDKQNLSHDLLREGLASVWGYRDESSADDKTKALLEIQKVAKDQKIGIWKNYVEPTPEDDQDYEEEEEYEGNGQQNEAAPEQNSQRLKYGAEVKVKVTEIVDACTFYVHIVDDPNVGLVEEAMKNFNDDGKILEDKDIKSGRVYAGLFPSEGTWHRVRMETKTQSGQWRGLFIDYGNRDSLEISLIRNLEEEWARIPPTAHQMFLAGLKAPGEGSEYFEPAGQAFSDLVWDRELLAKVELVDAGKYHVVLKKAGNENTINNLLLESAWIRVHPRPANRRLKDTDVYKESLRHEEVGKNTRKHIWEYGDVSDEEEDTRDDRGRVPSKKAKEKEAKDKEDKKVKEKEKEKKKAETKPKEKSGNEKAAKGKGGAKGGDKAAAAPAKGGKKK